MDPDIVDQNFAQLQQQSQQTAQLLQALAVKLQTAAAGGDSNAREWGLDLKEIALAIRDEEFRTGELLTSIHAMVDNHVQQASQPSAQPYAGQPAGYMSGFSGAGGGGMLQRFLGGGFGRAIATGAGFGIGDQIIQDIF